MKWLLLKIKKLLGRIMVQNNSAEELAIHEKCIVYETGLKKDDIKFDVKKSTVTNNKNFNF